MKTGKSPGRDILKGLSPCPGLSIALIAHIISMASPHKYDDVGRSGVGPAPRCRPTIRLRCRLTNKDILSLVTILPKLSI
jgi:hypothetical protein